MTDLSVFCIGFVCFPVSLALLSLLFFTFVRVIDKIVEVRDFYSEWSKWRRELRRSPSK